MLKVSSNKPFPLCYNSIWIFGVLCSLILEITDRGMFHAP